MCIKLMLAFSWMKIKSLELESVVSSIEQATQQGVGGWVGGGGGGGGV